MVPAPAYWLHWADSEVARVVRDGADVQVHLAAAQVVKLPDEPGGPGERAVGHVRHLVLQLPQATLDANAPLGDAIGRLSHGRLSLGDHASATGLAVPCQHPVRVQLSLAFANGTALDITAAGLQAGFQGEPDYRPSLAC